MFWLFGTITKWAFIRHVRYELKPYANKYNHSKEDVEEALTNVVLDHFRAEWK